MESENSAAGSAPKRKWKKKKSLLATAKKYGKKECWGRGASIPEDTYHYFVGILEVMKNGFDSNDEKQNFVNNVMERTVHEEVTLSCNQLGCRIVEELLPLCKPEDLERFIDAFSDELRTLCSDRFASFVLEQLISVCSDRACPLELSENKEGNEPAAKKLKKSDDQIAPNKYSDEHTKKCFEFTTKVSKFLLNNLEDFVWDNSANRILRASIKYLGGVVVAPCEQPKQSLIKNTKSAGCDTEPKKNKRILDLKYRVVPEEFKDIVETHYDRLSKWPQFSDMPYDTITSGLLQMLVYALGNVNKKLAKAMCKQLLDESFAPDSWFNSGEDNKKEIKIDETKIGDTASVSPNLPPVFESDPAVRLLEAVLHVSRSKTYTQIYAKCFINRLAILAVMPGLNFTVQRLFDHCTEKEEFEPMFDEISEKIDKILVSGNTGVIAAIGKACLRLQCKQVKLIQALEQALGCSDSENHKHFAILCARLLPLKNVDIKKHEEPYFVNIHGSLLLQTMLAFQRPKRIIDSLLAMSQKELLILLSDAKGCHIVDGFFDGKFVGAKSKELLVKRLKGTYQELAVAKYGSRALEKMFFSSLIEQRTKIMEELSQKSQLLNSTMFGQVIFTNLKIELFKKSFQSWKSAMDRKEKAEHVFKDIIEKK